MLHTARRWWKLQIKLAISLCSSIQLYWHWMIPPHHNGQHLTRQTQECLLFSSLPHSTWLPWLLIDPQGGQLEPSYCFLLRTPLQWLYNMVVSHRQSQWRNHWCCLFIFWGHVGYSHIKHSTKWKKTNKKLHMYDLHWKSKKLENADMNDEIEMQLPERRDHCMIS